MVKDGEFIETAMPEPRIPLIGSGAIRKQFRTDTESVRTIGSQANASPTSNGGSIPEERDGLSIDNKSDMTPLMEREWFGVSNLNTFSGLIEDLHFQIT